MQQVPVILITGFLGSGKTTLINWLLANHPDQKISLILNEFGNTQLESQFVEHHAEDIAELANGCMCCVAKSDIPRVVNYILEHNPQTEYILIEASGLSDPDPVREALQSEPVNLATYLESTICVIDTTNYLTQRQEHSIITSQIADADLVLLNKIELAGPEITDQVTASIQALSSFIRVLPFTADLSSAILLTGDRPPTPIKEHQPHHHEHTHDHYQTCWYETTALHDLAALQDTCQQLPAAIIRLKGVVRYESETGVRLARIQRVGSRVTLEPHESNLSQLTSTILCIGQAFDETAVLNRLRNCQLG